MDPASRRPNASAAAADGDRPPTSNSAGVSTTEEGKTRRASAPTRPILLVVRGLDPVGTGRQVELAAAGLAAAGHEVVVAVTTTGGSLPERLARGGFTINRIGTRPVGDPTLTLRLAGLVRRLRPAVVVGFGSSQIMSVAASSRIVSGCRWIVWLGLPPARRKDAVGLGWLDQVVVPSPQMAAACGRSGVAARRLAVVPPGIVADPGEGLARSELAARLGLDATKQWTLAVAPLEPATRLPRLLWAIDQLGVVRKDLQHVLVGAGPLLDALWRRARSQELAERLLIMAHCDTLPDLLGPVKLVWQSGEVALGGVLLDAMARGVPAVAVESDAARQLVIDGQTGRIVQAVPESELPRRAFGILEDEPLARQYGAAAAAQAAEMFAVEPFVKGLLQAVLG